MRSLFTLVVWCIVLLIEVLIELVFVKSKEKVESCLRAFIVYVNDLFNIQFIKENITIIKWYCNFQLGIIQEK